MTGETAARRAAPARLRWWLALLAAAAGGLLLDLSGPGVAWWPAAFPGAALVLAAVWQQRPGAGAAAGAVAGAAFWLPHISWLTLYLGPIPWLALSCMMVVWFTLFGLLAAIATRGLSALARRGGDRAVAAGVAAQSLAAAGLWVVREQLQSTWPYGGFAWGRLAHTQADGPLAQLVSWTGFAGLSGMLALACAVPVAVWFSARGRSDARVRSAAPAVAGALVVLTLLALVPAAPLERTGTLRVAAVQGNAKAGIFDDRESGDVIRTHIDATRELLDRLEESGDRVDVIVWPENSGEFDLPGTVLNDFRVARLAKRADAPIVVGSILRDPDGSYTNSSLVWGPRGDEGERYDKRRPVPFAEYMPHRDFYHAIVPDLIDLVQLEYAAGTRPAAFDVPLTTGGAEPGTPASVRAGIAICFDIIFDDHAVAMQRDGAEVVFAQTNNADFGRTDESAQQLHIARLRAIEMGRSVVNVSTVGTSAIVSPDGSDLDRLEPYTADAMVADVPLAAGETPALRFGAAVAGGWIVLGLAGAGAGALLVARRAGRAAA
ncbi:apolipoprotein N-acyltransferase [Leucobacter sp. CSA1]|uniref:Apolipoprotein N-acyltransferase n=1 Tax=Leucobacter chromiisoli TaxID=2796471 RepID=A0A934UVD3_9MICO|nr:apolipoprotein N-acyltransferase [Leucobacter chromiisoli]